MTSLIAFIQFDDNSRLDEPPFTKDGSVWSLQEDWSLLGCKEYQFIAAISGMRSSTGKAPLIPLRGLPDRKLRCMTALEDELVVGWLNYNELLSSLEHYGVNRDELHPAVKRVINVMALISQEFGGDRVRLVFGVEV